MRRRRYRKPAVNVSLFPFLAVLVCTMGSLIVLLVLVVQQARVYAAGRADRPPDSADTPQQLEELELQQEDHVWRREVLEQQRAELTDQLADGRLKLGHLEEHIRQLEQRWQQLEEQARRLQQLGEASQQDVAQADQELAVLTETIQATSDELARARHEAASRPRAFAIIPYEGPQGTRRRPVYVECTEQGIILQPEGIVLKPEDFEGPSGPGNPLDAALRAAREHLVDAGSVQRDGEPYPLLIVRPKGTVAYLIAREAIKSWDDEFGYELIDGQMKLEYPAADPVLKQRLARAVADARKRQQILAAAMPSRFKNPSPGFVATPHHGGFVPLGSDPAGSAGGLRGSATGNASEDESADGQLDTRTPGQAGQPGQPAERPGSQQPAGGPAAAGSPHAAGAAAQSMAGPRGANWALKNASAGATGITRPVRVACLPDRLIILPQRGEQSQPRVVQLPGPMNDAIDEFVSAVWKHTEQWGIAVLGGYWKPVLHVEVAPGAEQRFAELKTLLQDSGLDTRRTTP